MPITFPFGPTCKKPQDIQCDAHTLNYFHAMEVQTCRSKKNGGGAVACDCLDAHAKQTNEESPASICKQTFCSCYSEDWANFIPLNMERHSDKWTDSEVQALLSICSTE